ncbi:MAG TPA: hypothetical protein DDW77_10325 [Verrucomicrobiales bacterium]|jgi:hypothetical protein|nr:hypothetical protein [Pedosphaera sp.]HBF03550.1 hypothetical protein [Verrucomicrobiales bacterium]|tara:strand:+ start:248 stop:847 length:600 start_codon:yes stop_codon:yes gene_type:complete
MMVAIGLMSTGCHTSKLTEPPRTVAEMVMLSHAADQAIAQLDLDPLQGKKVFLDASYFESVDGKYVIGALREAIAIHGGILVDQLDASQWVMELRNRGLGMDTRSALFGLPAMEIPVPFAGRVASPELALYKANLADSIASFAVVVYDRQEGLMLATATEGEGMSKFNQYQLLGFIKWRSTDVGALRSTYSTLKQRLLD